MLKIIPKRFKWQWSIWFVSFAVVLFFALILTLGIISQEQWLRFSIIPLIISFACCIGGFLGGRIYFYISFSSVVIGYFYLLFSILLKSKESDIVQIATEALIGFAISFIIGFLLALLTQITIVIVKAFIKKGKSKKEETL